MSRDSRRKLNRDVLVLSKSFLAIQVSSVRDSLILVWKGAAEIVTDDYQTYDWADWIDHSQGVLLSHEEGDQELIHTPEFSILSPRVIRLQRLDKLPKYRVRCSRANIFARDNFTCQYCGRRKHARQLDEEHVIPKSRGGTKGWTNIVTACKECNQEKADRTPQEWGRPLLNKPTEPRWASHMERRSFSDVRNKYWESFL